jgi:hypothetical protein
LAPFDFRRNGRPGKASRVLVDIARHADPLGRMLSNGTIAKEILDAGAIFRASFRGAAAGTMATSPLHRLPGRATDGMPEHGVDARISIEGAIDRPGGQLWRRHIRCVVCRWSRMSGPGMGGRCGRWDSYPRRRPCLRRDPGRQSGRRYGRFLLRAKRSVAGRT